MLATFVIIKGFLGIQEVPDFRGFKVRGFQSLTVFEIFQFPANSR